MAHRSYIPVLLLIGLVALATGEMLAPPVHTAQHVTPTILTRVTAIDLPGPPGRRFDYLTIADEDHYLFSAHLAAGLLYVIDLRTHTVVKAIPDVPGIEGIAYVPELEKVYTSNWWENTIGVIDLRQMRVVKKLPTETKPDGIAYAPPNKRPSIRERQPVSIQ